MYRQITLFFFAALFLALVSRGQTGVCRDSNTVFSYHSSAAVDQNEVKGLSDGGALGWGGELIATADIQHYNVLRFFRTRSDGTVAWSVAIRPQVSSIVFTRGTIQIKEAVDGNIIVTGLLQSVSALVPEKSFVLSFSPDGQLMWSRNYSYGESNADEYPKHITAAIDQSGNIFFAVMYAGNTSSASHIIARLDSGGLLQWSREFRAAGTDGFIDARFVGIFPLHDQLVVLGNSSYFDLPFIRLTLDATDGKLTSATGWKAVGAAIFPVSDELIHAGERTYLTGRHSGNPEAVEFSTVIFDEAVQPASAFQVITRTTNFDGGWGGLKKNSIVSPQGDLFFGLTGNGNSNPFLYYARLDSSLIIRTQKKIGYSTTDDGYFHSFPLSYYHNDKINIQSSGSGTIDHARFDPDITGPAACFTAKDTAFMRLSPFSLQQKPVGFTEQRSDVLTAAKFRLQEEAADFTMTEKCKTINVCTRPVIHGPDSICVYSGEVLFKASTGMGCRKRIEWSVETTTAVKRLVNDSTIALLFREPWQGYLYSNISSSCDMRDSILVTVYAEKPATLLPADGSTCFGKPILLDPGPGYASYNWNTGEKSQALAVYREGIYEVSVAGSDGCLLRDSFRLIQVYPAPELVLPKGPVLCDGNFPVLDAGAGMTTYHWQDDSQDRYFKISGIGRYSVTVVNSYGCSASDSVEYLYTAQSPHSFLPDRVTICPGVPSELRPITQSFRSYLWDNTYREPVMTVASPGIYRLLVTDNNGCDGADSVLVDAGECVNRFFIPQGFTPDGDGLNESFRPVITGNLQSYHFQVFNRWGQLLFQTRQPGAGWNGKNFSGKVAPGVYVWTCIYQFAGEQSIDRKGTVVLIR